MAMRTDTERLDWLERSMHVDLDGPRYAFHCPPFDCPDPKDVTIRNAIDAAMDAEEANE